MKLPPIYFFYFFRCNEFSNNKNVLSGTAECLSANMTVSLHDLTILKNNRQNQFVISKQPSLSYFRGYLKSGPVKQENK